MNSGAIELITIGDELLLGFTIDSNAAHLARELSEIGVAIVRRTTVGDDQQQITDAVREALDRTGAVITTGGLGPTSDDITKESVAACFGRGMHTDQEHLAWMRERWLRRWNRELPESNTRQALVPDGAQKLENQHGSAPGIWLEDDEGRWVAMLPGVPREMRGMLTDVLIPMLRERFASGTVIHSRTIRTTGVAESLIADLVTPLQPQLGSVALAYLPFADGVDLRLTGRGPAAEIDSILAAGAELLRQHLGNAVYGEDTTDLAAAVLELCRARALTIAVAESCTGGMLGARLTAVPGSSDVVLGGVIAYHDDVKRALLGVRQEDLRVHGAVSEPVVRQMARHTREITGASIGVGITGIAGPTGGTPEKPVGTVWIAADMQSGSQAHLLRLWGDRAEIRHRSAQAALEMVRHAVESAPELSFRQS